MHPTTTVPLPSLELSLDLNPRFYSLFLSLTLPQPLSALVTVGTSVLCPASSCPKCFSCRISPLLQHHHLSSPSPRLSQMGTCPQSLTNPFLTFVTLNHHLKLNYHFLVLLILCLPKQNVCSPSPTASYLPVHSRYSVNAEWQGESTEFLERGWEDQLVWTGKRECTASQYLRPPGAHPLGISLGESGQRGWEGLLPAKSCPWGWLWRYTRHQATPGFKSQF